MANKFRYTGFAGHIHVTGEMFAKASEEIKTDKQVFAWMETLTDNGYNISIKGSQEDGNFTASLSATEVAPNFNKGLTLSAFGGNMHNSLSALYAKHQLACDGGEWPKKNTQSYG